MDSMDLKILNHNLNLGKKIFYCAKSLTYSYFVPEFKYHPVTIKGYCKKMSRWMLRKQIVRHKERHQLTIVQPRPRVRHNQRHRHHPKINFTTPVVPLRNVSVILSSLVNAHELCSNSSNREPNPISLP